MLKDAVLLPLHILRVLGVPRGLAHRARYELIDESHPIGVNIRLAFHLQLGDGDQLERCLGKPPFLAAVRLAQPRPCASRVCDPLLEQGP
eukprot:11857757-Heterocapsa_arctica.AAC.1